MDNSKPQSAVMDMAMREYANQLLNARKRFALTVANILGQPIRLEDIQGNDKYQLTVTIGGMTFLRCYQDACHDGDYLKVMAPSGEWEDVIHLPDLVRIFERRDDAAQLIEAKDNVFSINVAYSHNCHEHGHAAAVRMLNEANSSCR